MRSCRDDNWSLRSTLDTCDVLGGVLLVAGLAGLARRAESRGD